jgi:23S rRNA 5-hydroxycytidine C2501 synthase
MTLPTELLAPARDLVCGIAAINAGADAVYIGAPRFGARARAGNDLGDIAALVNHAHIYWARVYVTVNTLLHDDELDGAVDLITDLYGIGVDAVIVQDVGLLECDLPPIALVASTQMHNHTPERVAFLEKIGFQRAILARELTLDEIRAIRKATAGIELESFVHGALCVSYSGQCYMSYAVGGRSGNRGECAQPCRRRYDLVDSRGHVLIRDRFLLSLRDMNRIADLGAMLDAGVMSFKIEGRLKGKAYVTNVVSAYRQALDAAMAPRGLRRSSSGQSRIDFTPNVHKTFNRAYTPYFLHGRDRSPGSLDTPKMIGEPVGTITALNTNTFTLQTAVELHNGDGLSFFDTTDTLCGTVVNGTERTQQGLSVTPNAMNGLRVGTNIHRNRDHTYLNRIERGSPERTIGIRIRLSETADGFELRVEDEDGNAAVVRTVQEKSPARKPQQAGETARKQLGKTGGTPFHCEGVTLDWEQPYFLPFSTLNKLRRETLERLLESRIDHRPVMTNSVRRNDAAYPATSLDFRGNVLNAKAVAFYHRHGVADIEPAAESGLDMRGRVVMTTRYCIKEELGWCPRQKSADTDEAPGPSETLYLLDENGHRYELRFRCHQAPEGCGMDIVY